LECIAKIIGFSLKSGRNLNTNQTLPKIKPMKKHVFFISMLIMIMFSACKQPGKTMETKYADGEMISLSKEQLKEKILDFIL
jgi:hypothetical protein